MKHNGYQRESASCTNCAHRSNDNYCNWSNSGPMQLNSIDGICDMYKSRPIESSDA